MQSIETMLCTYDLLRHCRRIHAHTCTLHSSTFTSLLVCIRSCMHPPRNDLSTLSLDRSLHRHHHQQQHKQCPQVSAPYEDGQTQEGVGPQFSNEIGQIFQGIRNFPSTDTCFFIPKSLIAAHKHPTYGCISCNYRPQKEEKHHVRLTIGGDWINYPGNKSTPTANLTTHAQCQFQYLWQKGILSRADYSSKHHAPKHHQNVHPFFVFDNTTFPKQLLHMSPWHACHHIFGYPVSTQWSTVLNNNKG
jgi:hypothetical protein